MDTRIRACGTGWLVREPNVRFAVFCAVTAPQSRLVPCCGPVCSRRWTRWRSAGLLAGILFFLQAGFQSASTTSV